MVCKMHEDKKIEIMNIQYNSLTQYTVEFLHWIIQYLNYFALNLVFTHSLNFFIVTKMISDCHHFCNSTGGSFCWTMQLALSKAVMQVPMSFATVQVLSFYCNYDFFFAVRKMTISIAIMQLEVSATLMQLKIFAA